MPQTPPQTPANDDDARLQTAPEPGQRGRLALLIAAVGLAVLGLGSLVVILLTELLESEPWPGFVLLAYVCLPLGFLFMVLTVLLSIRRRRLS